MTNTEYMHVWRKKHRRRYQEIIRKAWKKWRKLHPIDFRRAKAKQNNQNRFGGKIKCLRSKEMVQMLK
jgi:hypothetical protein